jgi:sugar O-acyltransferase (sialic acid O-acetyltransferase NeuD family)
VPPATSPAAPTATTVVFGVATPYAWEVVETLWRQGREPVCVDNVGGADPGLPGLRTTPGPDAGDEVVVGPSSPQARALAGRRAHADGARLFPEVVDPTATVAATSRLGHGTYVNAMACVGACSDVGCLANLNRSASIGHHVRLGAFTSTGPGVVVCGGVQVGRGAFLGAGCVVLPDRQIGEQAVVGAGAVVTRDVPAGSVVLGNPARVVGEAPAWDAPSQCPLC